MVKATIFDLYDDLARCTLWVEDDLTRLVLTEFWVDTDIRILSASGRSGVEHLVRAAPRGFMGRNVVGFADRDFSEYDPIDLTNTQKPILFTPTHEFENLLLDFDVLSALSGRDTAADIEALAKSFAQTIQWWMACKRVSYEFFMAASAYFPGDPALPSSDTPMDRQSAIHHINKSSYRKEHQSVLRTWDEAYIERKIDDWGGMFGSDLTSGEWKRTFSGKEIFRHVRSNVTSLAKLATGATATQNDEDLGRRIAKLLRERFTTSQTASEFKKIRTALRTRAGLKP